ncbi:MAG: cytochrome c [Gemmatimonadetes bacterium]|nr:cytochrome c [Gemmatimonadota bacterium]
MFRGISLGKTGLVVVGLLGLGLFTGRPASPDVVNQSLKAATSDGAELYAKHCANCHGAEGAGDGSLASAFTPPPTDLTDAEPMAELKDETILEAMSAGKGIMPGLGSALSAEEYQAVLEFVRTLADDGADE